MEKLYIDIMLQRFKDNLINLLEKDSTFKKCFTEKTLKLFNILFKEYDAELIPTYDLITNELTDFYFKRDIQDISAFVIDARKAHELTVSVLNDLESSGNQIIDIFKVIYNAIKKGEMKVDYTGHPKIFESSIKFLENNNFEVYEHNSYISIYWGSMYFIKNKEEKKKLI